MVLYTSVVSLSFHMKSDISYLCLSPAIGDRSYSDDCIHRKKIFFENSTPGHFQMLQDSRATKINNFCFNLEENYQLRMQEIYSYHSNLIKI